MNKSVLICETCQMPFKARHNHYQARFCSWDHYVRYRRALPKPDLAELPSHARRILGNS